MFKRFGYYIDVDTPTLIARRVELVRAIVLKVALMLDSGHDYSDAIDNEKDDCDELVRELNSRGTSAGLAFADPPRPLMAELRPSPWAAERSGDALKKTTLRLARLFTPTGSADFFAERGYDQD